MTKAGAQASLVLLRNCMGRSRAQTARASSPSSPPSASSLTSTPPPLNAWLPLDRSAPTPESGQPPLGAMQLPALPGAWGLPPPPPQGAESEAWAQPDPCPMPTAYYTQPPPGWGGGPAAAADECIPTAWGNAGSGGGALPWRCATWPPADQIGAGVVHEAPPPPMPSWQAPYHDLCQHQRSAQQCYLEQGIGYAAGRQPWADPMQRYALTAAHEQQQQQQQQQAMYFQQQYLACPPPQLQQQAGPVLFAISPPQPIGRRTSQPRLPRKKKAALPAEPSFGCNSDGLGDGGSSAALLFSGEPSVAELQQVQEGDEESDEEGEGQEGEAAEQGAAPAVPHQRQLQQQPSIAYDRLPRPVAWRPYTYAEYQASCLPGWVGVCCCLL